MRMGYPGGGHAVDPAWVFAHSGTGLEMVFQFFSNFTEHDLICKVVEAGEYPVSGEGASVQFNAGRCVEPRGDEFALVHHGEVTVGQRVSRQNLVASLSAVCPDAMALAGIIDADPGSWPVTIGATTDVAELIDRLFVFAYCIEQAKRHLREEPALRALLT
ncbi:MAG: hypothetical protein K8W52_21580 [Deltaproteobacteria bacterium]|nr:hypothetical protein [Deltaproteobacteria bacterium]